MSKIQVTEKDIYEGNLILVTPDRPLVHVPKKEAMCPAFTRQFVAEPWNFRYVGFPHSIIMAKQNIVLEEYVSMLKETTDLEHSYLFEDAGVKVEISYLSVKQGCTVEAEIPSRLPYAVSGTNEGGVILSLWRD